jgi:hypothetical protein
MKRKKELKEFYEKDIDKKKWKYAEEEEDVIMAKSIDELGKEKSTKKLLFKIFLTG